MRKVALEKLSRTLIGTLAVPLTELIIPASQTPADTVFGLHHSRNILV